MHMQKNRASEDTLFYIIIATHITNSKKHITPKTFQTFFCQNNYRRHLSAKLFLYHIIIILNIKMYFGTCDTSLTLILSRIMIDSFLIHLSEYQLPYPAPRL